MENTKRKTSFHLFVVKTGGGREKQDFNFCFVKFDMPGDHANGDVKQREYTELRG